jgi:O-antigen/teichoic acid export membrane protein
LNAAFFTTRDDREFSRPRALQCADSAAPVKTSAGEPATAERPFEIRDMLVRLRGTGVGARLARGGAGTFIMAGVGAVAAVLLQMLVTRALGAKSFGDYAYALSVVNLLCMLAVLGFEGASLRFIASYRGLEQWALLRGYVLRSFQVSLLLALLVAAGFATYVAYSGEIVGELRIVLLTAAPLVPVLVVLKVITAHVQGLQRNVLSQSMQALVRPFLLATLLLVLVYVAGRQASAASLMTINVVVSAATTMVAWLVFRRIAPREVHGAPPTYDTRLWLRVAMPLFLIGLAQTLLTSTDTLMLGSMLGTKTAGLYAVASQVSTAVGFTISAVNGVVAPMIAELYAKGERAALQRLIVLASRGTLLVATPILLVLLIAGRPILGLFGPAFPVAWAPMAILCIGQFCIVAFGSVGFLLTMTGREREASIIIVISAVVNVALNALLIPRFGMNGSAAATTIATFLRSFLLSLHVRRELGFSAGAFGLRHARGQSRT